MLGKFLLVSIGGIIGTLLRYSVYLVVGKNSVSVYAPLVINLIGCLVAGIVWKLASFYGFSPVLRLFIFVGLIGAFTTLSAFIIDSYQLFLENKIYAALFNILVNNIFGFLSFVMGVYLSIFFMK
jgi:fluoride exporter